MNIPLMDVFFLGAGPPAFGRKPSALKKIALNTRALDWQIDSFKSIAPLNRIHYLGGYQVADVIENYPQLNFTVIPEWENKGVLSTLLKAPFTDCPAIISYSDTVYRNKVLEEIILVKADVVFGIDRKWKERFDQRPEDDINSAEKINIKDPSGNRNLVEFTGLIYLGKKAIHHLKELNGSDIGSSLIHLLEHFKKLDLSIRHYDVSGDWAEFNSPKDMANFVLGTKADTLARLKPMVKKSHIGKQTTFTSAKWKNNQEFILKEVAKTFLNSRLVVRSSSKSEDNWVSSNAGKFVSLLNIDGSDKNVISSAIDTIIKSYEESNDCNNQILIQEHVQNVKMSGVVFTCGLETGSPYYKFNFDDKSQSTETVTSGSNADLRTIILSRLAIDKLEKVEPKLVAVLDAIIELEELLGFDKLDIEFAVDDKDIVHIFQIRPITVDHSTFEVDLKSIEVSLNESIEHFIFSKICTPFIFGKKTLFANMPDWNPAEIIGKHPRPLSFSLYRQLITNDIWAKQRAEYGYRDVRPQPLIFSFSGQPYVDLRSSVNSFIPASLPKQTAERLANAYINIFADNPHFHDKIEFDVVYTIWTPGFKKSALNKLIPYGVSNEDIILLEESLKKITCSALTRLENDIKSISQLSIRRDQILQSELQTIDKIFVLLDDCKRIGTLAFSHAARAGFVATAWLKDWVDTGNISNDRILSFLKSFSTVAGEFKKDKIMYSKGKLSQKSLLNKYGHLRPGTYEITNLAYWEDPLQYLRLETLQPLENEKKFKFSQKEINYLEHTLDELGSSITPNDMTKYLKSAIKSREYVKFEFTKNLSKALDLCVELSHKLGLNRDDISFTEYSDLENLKLNAMTVLELKEHIALRKKYHDINRLIELPQIIQGKEDFYCFELFSSQPNFITTKKIVALTHRLDLESNKNISRKIILIPQADPGYDWLFGHDIAGLITKYGGGNSHMAIRAAETGLPAAIGVGEKLYGQIAIMNNVELDCFNHTIREVE